MKRPGGKCPTGKAVTYYSDFRPEQFNPREDSEKGSNEESEGANGMEGIDSEIA
jgi:hypothetical protein